MSHSHRGFSPVAKPLSFGNRTVSTVFLETLPAAVKTVETVRVISASAVHRSEAAVRMRIQTANKMDLLNARLSAFIRG
jgi:hypothetical protein